MRKNKPFYEPSDYERLTHITEREWRSPFYRDYARILHCPSFRRLQGKTQLFPGLESDFFRNRLTHSLEVAQIARGIAEFLNYTLTGDRLNQGYPISTDLVQCAALAHDMGHPPFGHAGERTLNRFLKPYGGFESNAQNFRILAKLEKKLDSENLESQHWTAEILNEPIEQTGSHGLNLCIRTLASIMKYDHKIDYSDTGKDTSLQKGYYESEKYLVRKMKRAILKKSGKKNLEPLNAR